MNLLVNESVDRSIERLRRDGHDVVYVAELSPSISDDQVLQRLSNATKVQIVAVVFRDRAPELLKAFTVISPGKRCAFGIHLDRRRPDQRRGSI